MRSSFGDKCLSTIRALLLRQVAIECDRIPLEFGNLPLRKVVNWILIEIGCILHQARPWGLPTHLQIEPTNRCNLRCALCHVAKGLNRSKGFMDPDIFKKLIDEIGDYVFLILFWGWGEPFLNPAAYEMIAYAKRKKIKIVSSTNGHIFSEDDHAERLVRSGLDALIVAIDGISQESYVRYRRRGELAKVLKGVEKIVQAKRVIQSVTPIINLRFLPMRHNEHEVPQLKSFADSLGVDLVTLKTLNLHKRLDQVVENGEEERFKPKNPAYQRFKIDPATGMAVRRKHNPCKDLWNYTAMLWDGKITSCCEDYSGTTVLGDLKNNDFRDIWFGKGYRMLRRRFRRDYRSLPLCFECSSAFEGGALGTELIVDAEFMNRK